MFIFADYFFNFVRMFVDFSDFVYCFNFLIAFLTLTIFLPMLNYNDDFSLLLCIVSLKLSFFTFCFCRFSALYFLSKLGRSRA